MFYHNGNLDKTGAFINLLNGSLPASNNCLKQLFKSFDNSIRNAHPEIAASRINGALNNAHGDWYEWLLAAAAWNIHIQENTPYIALLLPNIRSLDIADIYNNDVKSIILDLRRKITDTTQVSLITSNPDFVIVDASSLHVDFQRSTPITSMTIDNIEFLNNAYTRILNRCSFEDLIAFASVKSSLRPDRRLQIPHEGSLMKAIYTHIQTRQWIINAAGLKYYAFAMTVSDADIEALKTVATHSITTVQSKPQAAVDDVFEADTMAKAYEFLRRILSR